MSCHSQTIARLVIIAHICVQANVLVSGAGVSGPAEWQRWGSNGLNRGATSHIAGDRSIAAEQATSSAILRAAQGLTRPEFASDVGLYASRITTDRSTALRAFDRLGTGGGTMTGRNRRLLINRDSTPSMFMIPNQKLRNLQQLSMNAAMDSVERALADDSRSFHESVRAATARGMAFARLTTKRGTRPWEYSTNDMP